MEAKIENGKLILTMNIERPSPGNLSKSGKTHVIAGSGGFTKLSVVEPTTKKPISVGVNVTVPSGAE